MHSFHNQENLSKDVTATRHGSHCPPRTSPQRNRDGPRSPVTRLPLRSSSRGQQGRDKGGDGAPHRIWSPQGTRNCLDTRDGEDGDHHRGRGVDGRWDAPSFLRVLWCSVPDARLTDEGNEAQRGKVTHLSLHSRPRVCTQVRLTLETKVCSGLFWLFLQSEQHALGEGTGQGAAQRTSSWPSWDSSQAPGLELPFPKAPEFSALGSQGAQVPTVQVGPPLQGTGWYRIPTGEPCAKGFLSFP